MQVVIDNAAVPQYPERHETVDGFEAQFGANHLGHFLFNALILPSVRLAVKDTPEFPPRFVVVGSAGHTFGGAIDFDDLQYTKNYGAFDDLAILEDQRLIPTAYSQGRGLLAIQNC